jgi:hypothetical protein
MFDSHLVDNALTNSEGRLLDQIRQQCEDSAHS